MALGLLVSCAISLAAVIGSWIAETAYDFEAKTGVNWHFTPGVASVSGDKIVVSVLDTDDEGVDQELHYTPSRAATNDLIVGEHQVTFDGVGSITRDSAGATIGIQLVDLSNGSANGIRFAILNPAGGERSWLTPDLGEDNPTTNAEYIIRYEANYVSGSKFVRYSYKKPAAADFIEIGQVLLPGSAQPPKEFVHSGRGTITTMRVDDCAGIELPYVRFSAAPGMLTYLSGATISSGEYEVFDVQLGEGTGILVTGDVATVSMPGYIGTAIENPWRVYSSELTEGLYLAPGHVLRFAGSGHEIGHAFSSLHLGGLYVEPGATGWSIAGSGTTCTSFMGDKTGELATWYVIKENFEIAREGEMTLFGEVNLDIASGKKFSCNLGASGKPVVLDSSTGTRLIFVGKGVFKVGKMVAKGGVTLDYSQREEGVATCLEGDLEIDESTLLAFPEWLMPGTDFKLCSGVLSGIAAGTTSRFVLIGGVSRLVELTVDGNTIRYEMSNRYERWAANPGVFTWAGSSTMMSAAYFAEFNTETGSETGRIFAGDETSAAIPGQEGRPLSEFCDVFAASRGTRAPGYVLRFVSGSGESVIRSPGSFEDLALGGLIVEAGAKGYSIAMATDEQAPSLELGDASAQNETWFVFDEDFAFARGGHSEVDVRLVGKINFEVADGKILDLGSSLGVNTVVLDEQQGGCLRMHGAGSITNGVLKAVGVVTLDYSDLSKTRTRPFILGGLTIDANTAFVFPSTLAQNETFTLCGGTLTAEDGIHVVTVGSETFMAQLTFNLSNRTVKYVKSGAPVNRATLSGDVVWPNLSWESEYNPAYPVQLTVSKASTITINEKVALSNVLVRGSAALTLKPYSAATVPYLGVVRVAGDAKFGLYGSPLPWSEPLTLSWPMFTTGTITFQNISNRVFASGSIAVSSGTLSFNGKSNSFGGGLIIESGATFKPLCATNLLSNAGGARVTVRGTYDFGTTAFQSLGTRMEFNLSTRGSIVGTGLKNDMGAIAFGGIYRLGVLAVPGYANADFSAKIGYDADYSGVRSLAVEIPDGVVLRYSSTGPANQIYDYPWILSGEGSLAISTGATVLFSSDSFCSGGLSGAGTAIFQGLPTSVALLESLVKSGWTGLLWLRGAVLSNFDPSLYGNTASTLAFEGCRGFFAKSATFDPQFVLMGISDRYPASLTINSTFDNAEIRFEKLSGDGRLVLQKCPSGRCRVFLARNSAFQGSLAIVDEGNVNGVVIGANDNEREGSFAVRDGAISILRGVATLATNATWEAIGGIHIESGATVIDHGRISSPVQGSGEIRYAGEMKSFQPEAAARLTDAAQWFGSVAFEDVIFTGGSLTYAGNSNSFVRVSGASGRIGASVLHAPLTISVNREFRITGADKGAVVCVDKLVGKSDAALILDYGRSAGAGSVWAFSDVSEYDGAICMTNAVFGTLVLGEADYYATDVGGIQIADGATVRPNRNWMTRVVKFGDGFSAKLYVDGGAEDVSLMQVLDRGAGFDYVDVHLLNAETDPRRRFGLSYDGPSATIFIVSTPSGPSAEITDVSVVYGVDFTNATVRVSITNYWSGYDFDGFLTAEFRLYDANGERIRTGDILITGDGTYDISCIDLPGGKGADYRYDVIVSTIDRANDERDDLESRLFDAPGVHYSGDWFFENARTFSGEDPGSGVWTYPEGGAEITNEVEIAIDTTMSATGEKVVFKPSQDATNGLVHVEVEAMFPSMHLLEEVNAQAAPTTRVAAVTVVENAQAPHGISFAVWSANSSVTGGEFVVVSGNSEPIINHRHLLAWSVNYETGRVTYSADGDVLTNAYGLSSFPIPGIDNHAGKTVKFDGQGRFVTLSGDRYNANLASVIDGDVTNEYATVEEAVRAVTSRSAPGATNEVELLWDASWKPTTNDLGQVIRFTSEDGHHVSVDKGVSEGLERRGYRVVDNGDGTYSVVLITYYITFEPNGGTGVMPPQAYVATNLVFNLASNSFVKEGFDFKMWNQMSDGSGYTNWTDGAEIDMTPYGTNLTLYAQWTVAVRTITIAAADEFVYIEQVLRDDVEATDVRYFQSDAKTATGIAKVPVLNGSKLKIRFTTDLEKQLTFDYLESRQKVFADAEIPYDKLPHIYVKDGPYEILTDIQYWAATKGISLMALKASPYAKSSYALNTSELLTDSSVVEISDFRALPGGCSFKVTIDGDLILDASRVVGMVRISENLASGKDGWRYPSADEIFVQADGVVSIVCENKDVFVKVVIPKND